MNINILELIVYFILYSFLGWVIESAFRTICERKIINSGFLKGPFCPIYGIGCIIMLIFFNDLSDRPILLFFATMITLTAWEYIVGLLLEKIFKTKYWDYSNHKINFQGRICLENSICWGILGVIFIKYIHPFIRTIISQINVNLLSCVAAVLSVVLIVDTITTIIHIKNIKTTLEKIEKINNEIKERLKEIRALRKTKEEKTTAENIQQIVETLKKKRDKTISRLYKNVHRLKKAFPTINTNEITEILNQKIELRKKSVKNKKRT